MASTTAPAPTTSNIDQDFENGIRMVRDAHSKKAAMKDAEILQLRGELSKKDAEVKELQLRIEQLETLLTRSEKRVTEMSRAVTKLASFKQSVMESLANDEELEEIRSLTAGDRRSVGATAAATSS
ncbi:hypothetical protein HDU76_007604, partial [Blyttiomyces sp. JEL0837]